MSEHDEALRRANETMRRLQHEVRTPIGQIMGYAELLEEELEERGDTELVPDLRHIREAAQRLLDLADGQLRLDDDPGAPPLPELGQAADQPDVAAASGDLDAASRPPRLLVVDGDAAVRDLLVRRLEKHGFEIESALDGVDALRRIDVRRPDLVVLEVLMPGMGGLEVLERLRRTHSRAELPVVLATALCDSKDAVEGFERGANDYVTKPFDFPVLIARIRGQLEAHRTARQVADLARQLEFRSAFIRQALGRDVSADLLVELTERPDAVDLGSERKRVFAVVADLRGSRERAQGLTPAEYTAVLKNVLDGLAGVVEHYEGLVDSVSGDALLALFGLPLSRQDDAERGVACAIAMQLEMDRINRKSTAAQLPAADIGVGVAVGDVVMVGLGSGDAVRYKAVGDPLLDACVIEKHARGGEVWVSQSTREALGEHASVDLERDVELGANKGNVRVYRVLGLGGAQLISLRSVPSN